MEFSSRARSAVGRRGLLRQAARVPVAVALAPAAAALPGCSSAERDKPDALESLAMAARADTALAQAIAREHTKLAGTVTTIADARGQHARALQREIDRVTPPDPDAPKSAGPPPPQVPASAEAATAALSTALRTAQQRAAELVPTLPTYRAGLTGSISASCASMLEVLA